MPLAPKGILTWLFRTAQAFRPLCPQAEVGQSLAPAATSKGLVVLEPAYVPPKTQPSHPGLEPSLRSAGGAVSA